MENKSASIQAMSCISIMDNHGLIKTLNEEVQWKAKCFCHLLAINGMGLARIVQGRRSEVEQQKIYGLGRSEAICRAHGVPAVYARPAEKIRTWCLPDDSDHVQGNAIDFDFGMYADSTMVIVQKVAQQLQCEIGWNWRVRDRGHICLNKPYNKREV